MTRVGPGTPGGDLMRRYWHPVLASDELDADPVRKVMILGEELVCYRDLSGKIGLIGPRCAHRNVHMELGIPDVDGIRCPYHGWCYDESGACVDTPLEPANSPLKNKVRLDGYPVQELGGLIWAYLGPDPVPVLPRWDFLVWPHSIRQIAIADLECNWLQCHENSADPLHNIFLHGNFFKYQLERLGVLEERAPDPSTHRAYTSMKQFTGFEKIVVEMDEYGMHKGLQYSKELGAAKDNIAWFPYNVFPYYSRGTAGIRTGVNIRLPLDDTHTRQYTYLLYHVPGVEPAPQERVPSFQVPRYNDKGELILDFVHGQDLAAWEAQGTIMDRSQEQLGATDRALLQFRKLLKEQLRLVEEGQEPINVFHDESYKEGMIELTPAIGAALTGDAEVLDIEVYRSQYHLGYGQDDIDRYGSPATLEAIKALMAEGEKVRTKVAAG